MKIIVRITPPRPKFLPWLLVLALAALPVVIRSTNTPQAIGRIMTTDTISIEGRVESKNGIDDPDASSVVIFSGNKINVGRGIALIELDQDNGMVGLCGNASVSVIHSKRAMMYGLQSGTISVESFSTSMDRVLTPDFTVEWRPHPFSGRKQGVLRLDSAGTLCVQNVAGDVRIIDVLNDASLRVPTGASVQLHAGALERATFYRNFDCGCSPPDVYMAERLVNPGSEMAIQSGRNELVSSTTTNQPDVTSTAVVTPPRRSSEDAVVTPSPASTSVSTGPSQGSEARPNSNATTQEPPLKEGAAALTGYSTNVMTPNSKAEARKPSLIRSIGRKFKNFFRTLFFLKHSEHSAPNPPSA